jgi:hypothetical protein
VTVKICLFGIADDDILFDDFDFRLNRSKICTGVNAQPDRGEF